MATQIARRGPRTAARHADIPAVARAAAGFKTTGEEDEENSSSSSGQELVGGANEAIDLTGSPSSLSISSFYAAAAAGADGLPLLKAQMDGTLYDSF